MVGSHVSHMDENFRNTRDGKYPVHVFWAERFLIDPADPNNDHVRHDVPLSVYERPEPPKFEDGTGTFFSVKEMEGAWIPHGGGHGACPGRHLTKRLILYPTCLLLAAFDIEILTQEVDMDSSRFGIRIQRLKRHVIFRIIRKATSEVD